VEVYLHSFFTSALEGDQWTSSDPCSFNPGGRNPPVPTEEEVGWATDLVWLFWARKIPFAPGGN